MKKVILNCDDRIVFIMMSTAAMEKYNASFSQNTIDLRSAKSGDSLEVDYVIEGTVGTDAKIELRERKVEDKASE